ncbi:MAG: hypothetical protein HY455_03210 [Parcubacteria group bacterium]|nr:hypothetical protein [Parcubacteria group bacterium]
MKIKPKKQKNKPFQDFDEMAQNSATSGFIREAISETRSFVKEVSRTKHVPSSVSPSTVTKAHLYGI